MISNYKDVEMRARLIEGVAQPIRSNTGIEAAVNRGLAAAYLVDLEAGVAIMRAGGVPAHVVKRVLNNPNHRRATDWKH